MPRPAINNVISLIRDGWDDGDKWGSAIDALFDIAEVMSAAGIEVPEELEYRRSILDSRTLADMAREDSQEPYGTYVLAEEYITGNITAKELRLAALTLNRYVAACVAAGLDY